MSKFTFDLDLADRITAGAIGQPGQRVFYMQAHRGTQLVTMLAEKEQIASLATELMRLLDDLAERDPRLASSDDPVIMNMELEEPLEPVFRIAQMGLGYDEQRDIVVLLIQGASEEEESEAEPMTTRISGSRLQMRALSNHSLNVVAAGRPICGNCGRPIDAGGHFCPQRNGHGPISNP